jgi:hypothetical protein
LREKLRHGRGWLLDNLEIHRAIFENWQNPGKLAIGAGDNVRSWRKQTDAGYRQIRVLTDAVEKGAAGYVDKILRGAKPADLPVQLPTKIELVVNLKAARAIGFALPESFLLRADDTIE